MEIIDQKTKKIMEECKSRARDAGLKFDNETLEYLVTNADLIELDSKIMVPTLYDYWAQNVHVIQEKGIYDIQHNNQYETVINTRPAISLYNTNNPDWLNTMIFYHVIAHIDFFQNNIFFKDTWNYDFCSKALVGKRAIANMRSEHGRWVDYIIEFTKGIDNLVGYYPKIDELSSADERRLPKKLEFYFEDFLQGIAKAGTHKYLEEIERYNTIKKQFSSEPEKVDSIFFADVMKAHPEFEVLFKKEKENQGEKRKKGDLIQYIQDNSEFLNKKENIWMKEVMQIVKDTSMYFQPQLRTKILNEAWASYWHHKLFLKDERRKTHEVDYSVMNAKVTSLPEIGINPYALGLRLLNHIEDLADKGKISYEFERLRDVEARKKYDKETGKGLEFLFKVRENFNDFMLINSFVDQDFVDRHRLFVAGRRLTFSQRTGQVVWQAYIKSRDAEKYKEMLVKKLYHPPHITFGRTKKSDENVLYLLHHFEGKELIKEYIPMTMIGLEFLWGETVRLVTHEVNQESMEGIMAEMDFNAIIDEDELRKMLKYDRVAYVIKDRKFGKEIVK